MRWQTFLPLDHQGNLYQLSSGIVSRNKAFLIKIFVVNIIFLVTTVAFFAVVWSVAWTLIIVFARSRDFESGTRLMI